MNRSVFTRRLSLLSLAATVGAMAAMIAGTAQATLVWYDGFETNAADDGAGPTYLPGNLADQLGGSDAGSGIGFFDGAGGDPNPWLGVNNTDPADQEAYAGVDYGGPGFGGSSVGSLSRQAMSKPTSGDKVDGGPEEFGGCCHRARQSRDLNTPLQAINGQVYMGFLVNFGLGNPGDPHYRAIEFWNGKNVQPPPMEGDPPGTGDGRVGDGVLTMSLGVSSFGNYDDPLNDADGPAPDPNPPAPDPAHNVTANRQISLKTAGVREFLGSTVTQNIQLDEHLEFANNWQLGKTHSVVIGFDLTTDDVEIGGVGDTIRVWLDPTLDDTTPPAPSAIVSGIDLNVDSMSNMILFTFNNPGTSNQGAFDELRVATALAGAGGAGAVNNTLWSEVAILSAPEPASLSLVGLAAMGMLMTARRKRS